MISGALCSLLDKIICKGSIDFILFFGHIHDLKDVYLYLGVITAVVYLATYIKREQFNSALFLLVICFMLW